MAILRASVALAASLDVFGVASRPMRRWSIARWAGGACPLTARAISPRRCSTGFETSCPRWRFASPSRGRRVLCRPSHVPLGTVAPPSAPDSGATVALIVRRSLESRILMAPMAAKVLLAVVDIVGPPLRRAGWWRAARGWISTSGAMGSLHARRPAGRPCLLRSAGSGAGARGRCSGLLPCHSSRPC